MATIISKKADQDGKVIPPTTRDTNVVEDTVPGEQGIVWEKRPLPTYDALVCGAGGFVGGHLVNMLSRKGLRVLAVDIKPLGDWLQVNTDGLVRSIHSIDLRLKDKCDYLLELAKPEIIYNLVDTLSNDELNETMNRVLVNTHLIQGFLTKYAPAKYILAGGESSERILAEEMAIEFGYKLSPDMDIHITRLHNIYGPQSNILNIGELIPAGYECSYCYIDDAISALWLLTQSKGINIVEIGSGRTYNGQEVKGIIDKIAEQEIEKVFSLYSPSATSVDEDETKAKIGWRPSTPIGEGLAKTHEWISKEEHVDI